MMLEPSFGHERTSERQVVCLVLPELACELARRAKHQQTGESQPDGAGGRSRPLGVVLVKKSARQTGEVSLAIEPTDTLVAVDARARSLGIACGHTVAQACGLCSKLEVCALPDELLAETLAHLAESLLDRASLVAIEPPHSIWLEIGSVSTVLGGSERIAQEVIERIHCLGHAVNLAIAKGPRLAQLLARTTAKTHPHGLIVSSQATERAIKPLLLSALGFTPEQLGWLGQLGLITLGDLARFPRGEVIDRLGAEAARWVNLAHGEDDEPLVPLVPAQVLTEALEWEEPVEGFEPLRFVLRRLTTQIEARLMARGEAAEQVRISFQYERATARHRGVPFVKHVEMKLMAPLWYAEELERIISLRCEKTELLAPLVGLSVSITARSAKEGKQLEFSWQGTGTSGVFDETKFQALLAELREDIGAERVGTLRGADSHRPEKRSLFGAVFPEDSRASPRGQRRRPGLSKASALLPAPPPRRDEQFAVLTRILERPVPLRPPLRIGCTLFVGAEAYVIESLRFEQRLEQVEWWEKCPVSRDYVRLWLKGAAGGMEVLAYVDKPKGRCFIQAIAD